MIYINKFSNKTHRVINNMMREQEAAKPKPVINPPVYRDMQNIIDKAARGEKL